MHHFPKQKADGWQAEMRYSFCSNCMEMKQNNNRESWRSGYFRHLPLFTSRRVSTKHNNDDNCISISRRYFIYRRHFQMNSIKWHLMRFHNKPIQPAIYAVSFVFFSPWIDWKWSQDARNGQKQQQLLQEASNPPKCGGNRWKLATFFREFGLHNKDESEKISWILGVF